MPLTEAQWTDLARELHCAFARVVPQWSDYSDDDPSTVLELLARALTDVPNAQAALDERARRLVRRLVDRTTQ